MPSVPGIVDALEQAYQRGRGRSEKAQEFAKAYNADTVFEQHWKPVLTVLEAKALERM
jgi:hypothetical protein